jgi:hypothetical protein
MEYHEQQLDKALQFSTELRAQISSLKRQVQVNGSSLRLDLPYESLQDRFDDLNGEVARQLT